MNIHSRKELYKYLNDFDYSLKKETEISSVYFLIKYDNNILPVYFMPYKDIYFPTSCELFEFPMNENEIEDYVKTLYKDEIFDEALKFEMLMQRDNKHYIIESFQCDPTFLPNEFEIVDSLTETECLNWLIKHRKED